MKKIISVLFILILLTSCSKIMEVDKNDKAEEIEYLADIVLNNADVVVNSSSGEPLNIKGEVIEYYLDEGIVLVENMSFYQKDEDGNVNIKGTTKRGKIDTKAEIAYLYENTVLEQLMDGIYIACDDITFKYNKSKVDTDAKVSVKYGDIILEGEKLSADLTSLYFELGKVIKGEIK